MTFRSLLMILASVGLSAVAQIAMKAGVSGASTSPSGSVVGAYSAMLTSPKVLLGLACYALGALIWLRVLSLMDVSQAYPFVALGFVLTMALGFVLLGESPHLTRLLGAAFILVGVWLVGMR